MTEGGYDSSFHPIERGLQIAAAKTVPAAAAVQIGPLVYDGDSALGEVFSFREVLSWIKQQGQNNNEDPVFVDVFLIRETLSWIKQ